MIANQFAMLETKANGVSIEAWLNDIPLSLIQPPLSLDEAQPVNHFLIEGVNQLAVVVKPGATPTQSRINPKELNVISPCSASAKIAVYPKGAFPGDPTGQELVRLDWAAKIGDKYNAPLVIAKTFAIQTGFGRWKWQDAPVLALDPKTKATIDRLMMRLAESLSRGDPEPYIESADVRFAETSKAFGLDADARKAAWREFLNNQTSKPDWKAVVINAALQDLRLCANGRMVECIGRDWMPILRANSGSDGVPKVRFSMFLTQIGDALRVIR